VPDLLAGTITGTVTELSTVLPQVASGKVRVLGVAWETRSPQLADVPTMIEQGVNDFTAASYVGFLVPAGAPAEVMKALEAALVKALNDKSLPDALMTPQGFAGYIRREYELAREAAKIAGLTPA
jgi:tripartite-type tricarboxylate transporter receptor subunit TctC